MKKINIMLMLILIIIIIIIIINIKKDNFINIVNNSDRKGFTVTSNSTYNWNHNGILTGTIIINNNGILNINSNMTISKTGNIINNGLLNITNGTIIVSNSVNTHSIVINHGVLSITGGTFKITNSINTCILFKNNSILKLSDDGIIHINNSGISTIGIQFDNSKCQILGGTLIINNSKGHGINMYNKSKLDLNKNGQINLKKESNCLIYDNTCIINLLSDNICGYFTAINGDLTQLNITYIDPCNE